jgi:hypothetical protein
VTQVFEELRGELAACGLHRPRWRDPLQEPGGVGGDDRLGHTSGHQLAQNRVQPADNLGAGAAQVAMALGPHPQHRRVIIRFGLLDPR